MEYQGSLQVQKDGLWGQARKVVLQASLTLHFDRTDLNAPLPLSGENRMILDTIQVLAYD